ncbi:hypothetical protein KGQ71_00725 [Patescibacteria group bacterium]|nr:hypothetical protein [Patescibacteria group bacterium]
MSNNEQGSQTPTSDLVGALTTPLTPPPAPLAGQAEQLTEYEQSLPYRYERTYNREEAEFVEHRMPMIRIVGEGTLPRTDEDILNFIRQQKEMQNWFTMDYWRKKGKPEEQVELNVDGQNISVFNYCKKTPLTEEHIAQLERVYGRLAQHFPEALRNIRYFLINNVQTPSLLGDPERYPTNGSAMARLQAFQLFPRGTGLMPHRIQAASNFEGTVAHETTHLIQEKFDKPWSERYRWEQCMNFPDEWEMRDSPDGTRKVFYNKSTGEMAPQFEFPLQPEECVTEYAKLNMHEDICESMVAYLCDPDRLRLVSPGKYEILERLDQKRESVTVASEVVPKEQVNIPRPEPTTIKYYIVEPEEEAA